MRARRAAGAPAGDRQDAPSWDEEDDLDLEERRSPGRPWKTYAPLLLCGFLLFVAFRAAFSGESGTPSAVAAPERHEELPPAAATLATPAPQAPQARLLEPEKHSPPAGDASTLDSHREDPLKGAAQQLEPPQQHGVAVQQPLPKARAAAQAAEQPPARPQLMSVADALKAELGKCRMRTTPTERRRPAGGAAAEADASGKVLEDTQSGADDASRQAVLGSLDCAFQLLYPQDQAMVWKATYGSHEGPAQIYGEIPPESVQRIEDALNLGPGSVFWDLGSGIGRMVLQVHLTTQAKEAVGIEIAEPRHLVAKEALRRLDQAGLHSLLPESPEGDRTARFLFQNFTELDMSKVDGMYAASLFFPREVLWLLARKLASEAKEGTRILSLVKFPFDDYGARRLKKDDPMQALRLRGRLEKVQMTWGPDNSVFIYEVDRVEAFAPPFDGLGATTLKLLDEVYRRLKVARDDVESSATTEGLWNAILSLKPSQGDAVCELGTSTGWLLIRLAIETEIIKAIGVAVPSTYSWLPGKAREKLEELAPGRIPWHRRVDITQVDSLAAYVAGEAAEKAAREGALGFVNPQAAEREKLAKAKEELPDPLSSAAEREPKKTPVFEESCGDASIVVMNSMHLAFGTELDFLDGLAKRLLPGSVVLALGTEAAQIDTPLCVFGLIPLLRPGANGLAAINFNFGKGMEGMSTTLSLYLVAPREIHISKLGVPGLGSLREAVGHSPSLERAEASKLIGEKLAAATSRRGLVSSGQANMDVEQWTVKEAFDAVRFQRLSSSSLLGGLNGSSNGTLWPREAASSAHRLRLADASHLYAARFFGGAHSPYACLEANLYSLTPYAPHITKDEKAAGMFPKQTSTYGEVDPLGIDSFVGRLGGLGPKDVFFDLGSGLGKVVLQIYLTTQVGRIVGVELSQARHRAAVEALASLQRRYPELLAEREQRPIDLQHEDVLKADVRSASVIWMGSLAFPEELMGSVAKSILEQVSVGCRVLTMAKFPEKSLVLGQRQLLKQDTWPVKARWTQASDGIHATLYKVV